MNKTYLSKSGHSKTKKWTLKSKSGYSDVEKEK